MHIVTDTYPATLDQFGDLLVESHHIDEAISITDSPAATAPSWLDIRHAELTQRIEGILSERPDYISELETRERARVGAAAGMLAVMPHQGESIYNPSYQTETLQFLGRSTAILSQLAELRPGVVEAEEAESARTEESDESITADAEVEAAIEHEEAATGPCISIDLENTVTIDGIKLKLLPAQRVLFDFVLDAVDTFTAKEIYNSSEFKTALQETNQKSQLTVAFGSAFRGITGHLKRAGHPLEDFFEVVGGGPRTRIFRRNPDLRVEDKRILAQVDDVADYILGEIDVDEPLSTAEAVANYFGIDRLTIRHKPLVEKTVAYLADHLEDQGLRIDRENGSIVLRELKAPTTPVAAESAQDRGDFVGINDGTVVYQNEIFPITETEQMMIAVITDARQRGVTRAHLENFLKERNFDTSTFVGDFARLRHKIGPALSHTQHQGKARYILKPKATKK